MSREALEVMADEILAHPTHALASFRAMEDGRPRLVGMHAGKRWDIDREQRAFEKENADLAVFAKRFWRRRAYHRDLVKSRAYGRESARRFRALHPDKVAAGKKRWYQKNKARDKARSRAWYEKNREQWKAKTRAYYEANREAINAKQRAKYAANREAIRAKQNAARAAKRAKKKGAP